MKIVGIQKKVLQFKDGSTCPGAFLHLAEEREGVQGLAVENVFVSSVKLGQYDPAINDVVNIYYNRYGKVQTVVKLNG